MSQISTDIRILTHSEINKRIIGKPIKERPYEELLGPLDKYDDENYEIYCRKRKNFYETCKHYNKLNEETLICSKTRLHSDYRALLKCEFLEDNSENATIKESINNGELIRCRTERPIHKVYPNKQVNCSLEPWLRRYLILNKFIHAGRTILIRNRLLAILEKLKKLDRDQIKQMDTPRKLCNISYPHLFEKFLQ